MADEGINALAQILDGRMNQHNESPPLLDFGTIKEGSLLTDQFPVPIPKKDYIVCESVTVKSGDRVLVAWVGDDAVVIDTILKA